MKKGVMLFVLITVIIVVFGVVAVTLTQRPTQSTRTDDITNVIEFEGVVTADDNGCILDAPSYVTISSTQGDFKVMYCQGLIAVPNDFIAPRIDNAFGNVENRVDLKVRVRGEYVTSTEITLFSKTTSGLFIEVVE